MAKRPTKKTKEVPPRAKVEKGDVPDLLATLKTANMESADDTLLATLTTAADALMAQMKGITIAPEAKTAELWLCAGHLRKAGESIKLLLLNTQKYKKGEPGSPTATLYAKGIIAHNEWVGAVDRFEEALPSRLTSQELAAGVGARMLKDMEQLLTTTANIAEINEGAK